MWLADDTRGNVATELATDGTVLAQAAYDPYGTDEASGSDGDPAALLGFQSSPTDEVTGATLVGPRQYDPQTGRFTTADHHTAAALDLELATDPLTGNPYIYAGANPVSFHDDGHRLYAGEPHLTPPLRGSTGGTTPADDFARGVREGAAGLLDAVASAVSTVASCAAAGAALSGCRDRLDRGWNSLSHTVTNPTEIPRGIQRSIQHEGYGYLAGQGLLDVLVGLGAARALKAAKYASSATGLTGDALRAADDAFNHGYSYDARIRARALHYRILLGTTSRTRTTM